MRYTFRPMIEADLPLLREWLRQPHVAEWWGAPDEQFTLVSGDLHEPAMDQYIVALDDRPFAYIQCYDIAAWPESGFGQNPPGTRAIDQFIGEPDMVGRGHGSALIAQFVADCHRAGVPRVLTDPDPMNARAVRAYEKAGFSPRGLVQTTEGLALLMACEPAPSGLS